MLYKNTPPHVLCNHKLHKSQITLYYIIYTLYYVYTHIYNLYIRSYETAGMHSQFLAIIAFLWHFILCWEEFLLVYFVMYLFMILYHPTIQVQNGNNTL